MHSTPLLGIFVSVVPEMVPMFVWLKMALSLQDLLQDLSFEPYATFLEFLCASSPIPNIVFCFSTFFFYYRQSTKVTGVSALCHNVQCHVQQQNPFQLLLTIITVTPHYETSVSQPCFANLSKAPYSLITKQTLKCCYLFLVVLVDFVLHHQHVPGLLQLMDSFCVLRLKLQQLPFVVCSQAGREKSCGLSIVQTNCYI